MSVAGEHQEAQDMNWADYIDALRNSAWEKIYRDRKRQRGGAAHTEFAEHPANAYKDTLPPPKGGTPS